MDKIHALALTRAKNKKWLKGKKGKFWLCGDKPFLEPSRKGKCAECGDVIYYNEDCADGLVSKNVKKICSSCCLKNHRKEMNEEQIKILELTIAKLKYSDNFQ